MVPGKKLNEIANAGNEAGGKLTASGSMKKFGTLVNPGQVNAFILTLDNTGAGSATLYRLFDADGIVADIRGTAGVDADSGTITPAVITATTIHSPVVFDAFNYQVSSDVTQFSQQFEIIRGEIDGRLDVMPNIIAKAKRNTQFDPLLLTIDEPVKVDGQTAIEITVLDDEIVNLTFFVVGFTRC